jgi:hypothetical protein
VQHIVPDHFHIDPPKEPDRVESGTYFLPGQPYTVNIDADQPITDDDMKAIRERTAYIYAYGYVSYYDIFGRYRASVFCGFYDPAIPFDPKGRGVPICPHNNRVTEVQFPREKP